MYEVRIPKVGMSTIEVDIVEVHFSEGQPIEAGEPVAEVSADKVNFLIEAERSGTVESVLVAPGDVCSVGQVIMLIRETLHEEAI